MVLAGLYGRKSGRGFYDYTVDPPVPAHLGL
jgi:3-hydroxyacyl-CoA dehydrogenase